MLVYSDRHKSCDLELWSELEEADKVYFHSSRMERLINDSLYWIKEFLKDNGRCYVSVSWGKDSVAIAHLVRMIDSNVPIFHVRSLPWANPDCMRIRDVFQPSNYFEKEWSSNPEGKILMPALQEMEKQYKADKRIIGIRADESGGRRLGRRSQGVNTKNSCRPIIDWKSRDVFAYLAGNELPVHPAYAMLGCGKWDRDRIRVDVIGIHDGEHGGGIGRHEWEWEYYSDIVRGLEALE